MGLRERLGLTSSTTDDVDVDDVPVVVPSAWVRGPDVDAPSQLKLQPLGEAGFGLRHPETGEAIAAGAPYLRELGAVIANLEDIGPRRDAARVLTSAPGQVLRLVAEGRRVAVFDRSGEYDIGYLDDDTAGAVHAALDAGVELRSVSLWETNALDGQRTGLRVLIVPPHARLIVGAGREIDLTAP